MVDTRQLFEIDETGTDVRLVVPSGLAFEIPLDFSAVDLTGWGSWAATAKLTPGSPPLDGLTIDSSGQAAGEIILAGSLELVNTIATSSHAVWAMTVLDPQGSPHRLMSGPFVVQR